MAKNKTSIIDLFIGIAALVIGIISSLKVIQVYREFGFEKAYLLGPEAFKTPAWIFSIGMLIGGISLIVYSLVKLKRK
jgi:hypothetical membrane protein